MRKRSHRMKRPATAPCIVAVGANDKHEMGLIQAVQAFRMGIANRENFLDLCDARDITAIAYNSRGKHVQGLVAALSVAETALLNILDRWKEQGKFGASADELAALALLIDTYLNFWIAQSGELYRNARIELRNTRAEQRKIEERAAA